MEMPQSATVARALRLITESTGVVPFCQCLTLRLAAREALGGTGRRLVGEAAAADGEGMAGREASDERGAARLARVEGAGIARATPKGIVPVSPAGHSEVFPLLIPYGSCRELDSTGFCSRKKNLNQKPCESCKTNLQNKRIGHLRRRGAGSLIPSPPRSTPPPHAPAPPAAASVQAARAGGEQGRPGG